MLVVRYPAALGLLGRAMRQVFLTSVWGAKLGSSLPDQTLPTLGSASTELSVVGSVGRPCPGRVDLTCSSQLDRSATCPEQLSALVKQAAIHASPEDLPGTLISRLLDASGQSSDAAEAQE